MRLTILLAAFLLIAAPSRSIKPSYVGEEIKYSVHGPANSEVYRRMFRDGKEVRYRLADGTETSITPAGGPGEKQKTNSAGVLNMNGHWDSGDEGYWQAEYFVKVDEREWFVMKER